MLLAITITRCLPTPQGRIYLIVSGGNRSATAGTYLLFAITITCCLLPTPQGRIVSGEYVLFTTVTIRAAYRLLDSTSPPVAPTFGSEISKRYYKRISESSIIFVLFHRSHLRQWYAKLKFMLTPLQKSRLHPQLPNEEGDPNGPRRKQMLLPHVPVLHVSQRCKKRRSSTLMQS